MAHGEHGEFREEFGGEHPHSYDHTEPKYSLIAILGGVTVVMLIVVAIGIQLYWQRTEETQIYEKVLSQDSWQLRDLRQKEAAELASYGYVDKARGAVRIPIDQAMRMVAQEAAENRPKYPTAPYAVKTPDQLAAAAPAVSPQGAAATAASQNQGITSNPNVQQSSTPAPPSK